MPWNPPGSISISGGTITANVSGNVNANVTNSSIAVTGSVNANITNSSINANITNSTVDIATTAPIDVSAATVDTASQVAMTSIGSTSVITAGTTSGFHTFSMPATAEGYELVIYAQNSGQYFACDIRVRHLDASNNIIALETFTTTNYPITPGGNVAIRGKLFGTQIAVQVVAAAAAWINAVVIPGGAGTADNLVVTCYALPTYYSGVGRMSQLAQTENIGMLTTQINDTVAATGNQTLQGVHCLVPYMGPVSVHAAVNGVGMQGHIVLQFFSVAQGTTPLTAVNSPSLTFAASATLVPWSQYMIFPAMVCNILWVPASANVAGTVDTSVYAIYD